MACSVSFAGFDAFTAEVYELLKALIKSAKSVNISAVQSLSADNVLTTWASSVLSAVIALSIKYGMLSSPKKFKKYLSSKLGSVEKILEDFSTSKTVSDFSKNV